LGLELADAPHDELEGADRKREQQQAEPRQVDHEQHEDADDDPADASPQAGEMDG
jgi:hypothetical protein